jgi:hypothetical protein
MGDHKASKTHPARLRNCLEFVEQPRLTDTRVRHHSDDLTVSRLSLFGGMLECLHFAPPPNEFGQPPTHRTLKARAKRSYPGHLKHLDRLTHAFHHCRAE